MKNNVFYSLSSNEAYKIEIKKSEFIAYAKMVETQGDAENFIDEIRKEHSKATHVCYAYSINNDTLIQKMSDDGEPSGTAGMPLLNLIKLKELKNTCIIVVRYFGGIKLGAGGLARAYLSAATNLIDRVGIKKFELFVNFYLELNYEFFDKLMYSLNKNNFDILDTKYSEIINITIICHHEREKQLIDIIEEITNGNCLYNKGDYYFKEII